MVHYVQSRWNILVQIWPGMILGHVVQEIDVGETPAREFLRVWPNLELFYMMILFRMSKM